MITYDPEQKCFVMGLSETRVRISRVETWFSTPFGIVNNSAMAVATVLKNSMDPGLFVKPVVVAIDEKENYEVWQ